MITINNVSTDKKAVLDALKGDYGTVRIGGLTVRKQGGLLYMQGEFTASTEAVEIPSLECRVAMTFGNENRSVVVLSEPKQAFIKVPDAVKGSHFICFATCILNYE